MSIEILNVEKAFIRNDDKKILNTIENFQILLRLYKITCRYNVISKRCEILIDGELSDNCHSRIVSRMEESGLSTKNVDAYISYVSIQNQYNPVIDWITSKAWDGESRLAEFYNTISTDKPLERDVFLFRWLVTCVAMADNDGIDAAGCLVLQGAQGLGKTWWFRRLCPPELIRTDASLDTKDKDSRMQILRFWIVELGEIDATFRKSDISALKSFITAKEDHIRLPYARTELRMPRKTALGASVNNHFYLHDETGNRRYWTIPVTAIDSRHEIDMQQLWAEIYHRYKFEGEGWELNDKEKDLLPEINNEHTLDDPIYEMLAKEYDWNSFLTDSWKTATEIAVDLGYKNITQRETRLITSAIRRLNVHRPEKEKKPRGYTTYALPHRLGC